MFRGTTARTVVSLLAAVLLALPFFAATSSFAHAYTTRQVEAKAQPGIKPSVKALRDEIVTMRGCDHPHSRTASSGGTPIGGPADPARPRDRHRATVAAAPASQEPERALLALDPAAAHQPARPAEPHHRSSRSSTAHSPAALQIFRC
ncbi:hypothetical protein OG562_32720 [Streptomyces sp. NBC_01275]|uniref:hypothetical protein n=1 Tax=Streptomyces sp. NBC_01275 TaxID=2903807 RepID=UPI0022505485|nr:hypothetical protein [Streptomyces sp. NBC_01275]MCX4765660.1 hypothetical protein [Streptomyces sp. NBC_01275]